MPSQNPRLIAPAVLCGLMVLGACSTLPAAPDTAATADLEARYAKLAESGGTVFRLDPAQSSVRIYAFRAGTARQFGHNHVLAAPRFAGYAFVPAAGTEASHFDLAFRLDELELDNPAHRKALGGAFATPLGPVLVASTRDNMLGALGLQAEQFPLLRISAVQLLGEAPKLSAQIRVELHGQQRQMWVPLTVEGLPDKLKVQGAVVLLQSDFGIKPYTVLGGLLAVQDPVVVEFSLQGVAGPGH